MFTGFRALKTHKSLPQFHESYQEHNCSILGEVDVLKLDIKGSGLVSKLQRAWCDLLLVSKKDVRSRMFYTSSHALRMERFRHYRKFKNKIHPFSKFRSFWECLMVHVFLLRVVLFNINTSFVYGDMSIVPYCVVAAFEVLIVVDVVVNLKTGVVDEDARCVILDTDQVVLRYCTTNLFFHVSSAIPLQWIMFLRYGAAVNCALCKCNRFTSALKLLNLISLARFFQCSSFWQRERNSLGVTLFFKFLRISVLGLTTLFEFNDLTDMVMLNILMTTRNLHRCPRSMNELILKYGDNDFRKSYSYNFFIHNVNRAFKSFCLYNFYFSDFPNLNRMVISLAGYFISKLFFLWNIIEIFGFVVRLRYGEDCILITQEMTLNAVRKRQLPSFIGDKVREYFNFKNARYHVINSKNTLYKSLPRVLKQEVTLATNRHYIARVPYFSDWPLELMKLISLALKEQIHLKSDLVAQPLYKGDGMYIVKHGELAVYTDDEETGHLIDGDYFGEVSLVTEREIRTSSVIAITPSVLLFLNKMEFRTIMRSYPQLFHNIKMKLRSKYDGYTRHSRQVFEE